MQLGILVEGEAGLTWDQWRRLVDAAEDRGFDSIWISDHLLPGSGEDRGGLDAWLALAVAAAGTQRVKLGPLVTPITFRQPGLLARMAANLDSLSQGRFVLGLGLGWNAHEHAAYDLPFPPLRERARLLEAGLATIRRALPARVPVLIGGKGRSSLERVARHADEWNLTTSSPALYTRLSQRLAEVCQAVGRDPATIRRSVLAGILVGENRAELARRGDAMRRLVSGLTDVPRADVPRVVRERGWVAGTPGEVVAALRELAEAGVDRAVLGHYDVDDTRVLDLIAGSILPALERRATSSGRASPGATGRLPSA